MEDKMKCKTCKWWMEGKDSYDPICHPEDPDTYKRMEMPFEVKECKSPKLLFHERPLEADGATVQDGSNYWARLCTAQDFGCVNWEEDQSSKTRG